MVNRDFKQFQMEIDKLIEKLGGYWPPLSMLASVVEEVGELSREINSREKYKIKKESEKKVNIGEELGDIIFSILCIANYYKLNMDNELGGVLNKYYVRDLERFKK